MDDAGVALFIRRRMEGRTVAELHKLSSARFPEDRAWSRQMIGDFLRKERKPEVRPSGKGNRMRRTVAVRDPEVARFLLDQMAWLTIDELRRGAILRFEARRVPSRAAIGRFVVDERGGPAVRFMIERKAAIAGFVGARCGRLTLDALRAALVDAFPGQWVPSRSALGRYVAALHGGPKRRGRQPAPGGDAS